MISSVPVLGHGEVSQYRKEFGYMSRDEITHGARTLGVTSRDDTSRHSQRGRGSLTGAVVKA